MQVDHVLERWLRAKATEVALLEDRTTRQRINHQRIDALLASPLAADPDAVYVKQIHLNLSTLSPCVTGPNSTKLANPLHEIPPQNIKINGAFECSDYVFTYVTKEQGSIWLTATLQKL